AVAVPVSAIPLTSGTSGPPTLFSDDPGTLVDSRAVPVAPLGGAYTGMLISAVYQDATGRLEFDYQFINNGPDNVHRLTGFNFTGFSTDVGYRVVPVVPFAAPSPGALPPVFADRDADGSTVGFEFSPGIGEINAGETSVILVIKTD